MKAPAIVLTGVLAAFLAGDACGERPEGFAAMGRTAASNPSLAEVSAVTAGPPGKGNLPLVALPVQPSAVISPDSPPPEAGPGTLSAADCAGQYGPLTFLVWSATGGELSVHMSDLKSSPGRMIGRENFDVRILRYARVSQDKRTPAIPLLLESLEKTALPASSMAQIWVTYFIPADAPAGVYQGTVTVAVGERKAELPMALKVYSFKLVEPDVNLYIYCTASEDPRQLDLVRTQWVDQRCHGMNCSQLSAPVTRGGDLVVPSLARLFDAYQSAGFARPWVFVDLYNRIAAEWLNTPDKSIGMWGAWFRYYPFSERLDRRFAEAVRILRDQAAQRSLKVVLTVADEPGSHPWTTAAAQHYNDLIKREAPDVLRELTVGGGWAMKRDEEQLWKGRINIWTTNRWLAEKLELVRKNDPNAAIQVYNMAGGGSGEGGTQAARLFYGFFNWKAQAAGAAQWCYYHSGTPKENYTWPAADPAQGNVPTLRWEAAREGAKDRRYVATLEKLLKTRKPTGDRRDKAAEEGAALLREISSEIKLASLEAYDPISGGRIPAHTPGTYEHWRAEIADCIERLELKGD
jgi:hypothetical protein